MRKSSGIDAMPESKAGPTGKARTRILNDGMGASPPTRF